MKKIVIAALALLTLVTCANAQMVGATNRQQGGFSTSSNDPVYRPTGAVLHFEAGGTTNGQGLVTLGWGYQMTPNVMLGAGLGLYGYSSQNDIYYGFGAIDGITPLFFETRLSTPGYRWSVYADLKLGYDLALISSFNECPDTIDYRQRFFVGLQGGVGYKNLGLGMGFLFMPKPFASYDNVKTDYNYSFFYFNLSYNLPVAYLRRVLMF